MYRTYAIRVAALLIFGAAWAGCSKPGGLYVVPEHKDLGLITNDDGLAVAEFELVNGLDRPVEIKEIFPSCNCTTVKLSENPIASGESAVLRAEADLGKRAGRQDFSLVFLTDSAEFPHKRVTFSALVPATGARERRMDIGSFYPGSEVNVELPVKSFARGSVKLMEGDQDEDGSAAIGTDLVNSPTGQTMLVLKGSAPRVVGAFSKRLRFREVVPELPDLGKGTVDLELFGSVVARWNMNSDLYGGFVSLENGIGTISLSVERKEATGSGAAGKRVSKVMAEPAEEWLLLKNHVAFSDRMELTFTVHGDKLKNVGAVKCPMTLTIRYADGSDESYTTTLFARIMD